MLNQFGTGTISPYRVMTFHVSTGLLDVPPTSLSSQLVSSPDFLSSGLAYFRPADLNGDGLADSCQISNGLTSDRNGDGVPDEVQRACIPSRPEKRSTSRQCAPIAMHLRFASRALRGTASSFQPSVSLPPSTTTPRSNSHPTLSAHRSHAIRASLVRASTWISSIWIKCGVQHCCSTSPSACLKPSGEIRAKSPSSICSGNSKRSPASGLMATQGRKCLCNALLANIGLGQVRAAQAASDGGRELPLVTAGDDVIDVARFLKPVSDSYRAVDVLEYLLRKTSELSKTELPRQARDALDYRFIPRSAAARAPRRLSC